MQVLNMSGLAIEIHKINFMLQNPFEIKNTTSSLMLLHMKHSGNKRRDKSYLMKKIKIIQMFKPSNLKLFKNIKYHVKIHAA